MIVFTKDQCPKCAQIKSLMDKHEVEYHSVKINDENIEHLRSMGVRSVPAVVVDEVHMGGLEEMQDFLEASQ
jgi:glutaredoxin